MVTMRSQRLLALIATPLLVIQWASCVRAEVQYSGSGVVVAKALFQLDKGKVSYVDEDGTLVFRHQPTQEWRVYFRIDDLGNYDGNDRMRLLNVEAHRDKFEATRYRFQDKEWYDGLSVGDRIRVHFRVDADGDIVVTRVDT